MSGKNTNDERSGRVCRRNLEKKFARPARPCPIKYVSVMTEIFGFLPNDFFQARANEKTTWKHFLQRHKVPFNPAEHRLVAAACGRVLNLGSSIGACSYLFPNDEFKVMINLRPVYGIERETKIPFLIQYPSCHAWREYYRNSLLHTPGYDVKFVTVGVIQLPDPTERLVVIKDRMNEQTSWRSALAYWKIPFNPKDDKLIAARRVFNVQERIGYAASFFNGKKVKVVVLRGLEHQKGKDESGGEKSFEGQSGLTSHFSNLIDLLKRPCLVSVSSGEGNPTRPGNGTLSSGSSEMQTED